MAHTMVYSLRQTNLALLFRRGITLSPRWDTATKGKWTGRAANIWFLLQTDISKTNYFPPTILFSFLLSFSLNGKTALNYCNKKTGLYRWHPLKAQKHRYSAKIYSVSPGTSIYTGWYCDNKIKWKEAQLGQNLHISSLQIKYDVQILFVFLTFRFFSLHTYIFDLSVVSEVCEILETGIQILAKQRRLHK